MFEVGKANGEAFGHAAEDGGVDVIGPIRSTEDKYAICTREKAIPEPIEFMFRMSGEMYVGFLRTS